MLGGGSESRFAQKALQLLSVRINTLRDRLRSVSYRAPASSLGHLLRNLMRCRRQSVMGEWWLSPKLRDSPLRRVQLCRESGDCRLESVQARRLREHLLDGLRRLELLALPATFGRLGVLPLADDASELDRGTAHGCGYVIEREVDERQTGVRATWCCVGAWCRHRHWHRRMLRRRQLYEVGWQLLKR